MTRIADSVRVVDVDTHIIEPYDLWTSRLGKKWDLVPHVETAVEMPGGFAGVMTKAGDHIWVMGDEPPSERHLLPVGVYGMAGYEKPLPDHPRTIAEVDRAAYDPHERLRIMDRYGLYAQILYPNVGGFGATGFLSIENNELKADCVRAYNDFMHDWCSADARRLIPLAATPFWDLEFALEEIGRCVEMGHRGMMFTWQPEAFSLPHLGDPYWNPLWELCVHHDLPINFHVGSGVVAAPTNDYPGNGFAVNFTKSNVMGALNCARSVMEIIGSRIVQDYPTLKFVSVESGIGWIPFIIEHMTWLWGTTGVYDQRPDLRDTTPLELFKKHVYGTFWFEDACVDYAVDYLGPDNLLFETDFPHPTSVAPGPNTPAKNPIDHIEERFADGTLSAEVIEKILSTNAMKLYHLD